MYNNPWPGITARRQRDEAQSQVGSLSNENKVLKDIIKKLVLNQELTNSEKTIVLDIVPEIKGK